MVSSRYLSPPVYFAVQIVLYIHQAYEVHVEGHLCNGLSSASLLLVSVLHNLVFFTICLQSKSLLALFSFQYRLPQWYTLKSEGCHLQNKVSKKYFMDA